MMALARSLIRSDWDLLSFAWAKAAADWGEGGPSGGTTILPFAEDTDDALQGGDDEQDGKDNQAEWREKKRS